MSQQNVEMRVDGEKLTITVDLKKRLGPSKSGKTQMVATTQGFQKLNGKHAGVSVAVNVCAKE